MRDTDLVSAITGNTGGSGWRQMLPQVDSSDFPTQWMPSALECSIIDAQAKEIEKLRGQNEQLREAAALVAKESAELLEQRWIPVNENLYPGTPDRAGDGSGCNPFHAPAYVPNPAAPRNCCAGGFGSTKIGEEVKNAETE